ncbi:MAG: hypothetical protein HZY75_04215 [Nocardioidaceae bacterium]|nr:MAG: hypothetical protein HZY75_04215 [Nocardioidaceae bacterium]
MSTPLIWNTIRPLTAIGPMFVNTLFAYAELLVEDYREATEGASRP